MFFYSIKSVWKFFSYFCLTRLSGLSTSWLRRKKALLINHQSLRHVNIFNHQSYTIDLFYLVINHESNEYLPNTTRLPCSHRNPLAVTADSKFELLFDGMIFQRIFHIPQSIKRYLRIYMYIIYIMLTIKLSSVTALPSLNNK